MKHFVYRSASTTISILLNKKPFTMQNRDPRLKRGDKVLVILKKNTTSPEEILPCVALISATNDAIHTATLESEVIYNSGVSIEYIGNILNKIPDIDNVEQISSEVFTQIVGCMGGVKLTEKEVLGHIGRYIENRGYYFEQDTLYNYHICLKTRPFVILAGLSGTGKSKLSQLYAEAMGYTMQNKRYLRLAVRPNWNDDRVLIGYVNVITGEYITEPAIEFLIKASKDKGNLYFFCLDEMNLAHVEYYFSQFLSALEEENPANRRILLISEGMRARMDEALNKQVDIPDSVCISPNVLFTGTINVDETTHSLSDKVIDRANTIEFFTVDLDKIPEAQDIVLDPLPVSATVWHSYQTSQRDTTYRPLIVEIGKLLNRMDTGLGFRVVKEIELYIANSKGLLAPEVAIDLQVKQRILPRVRGSRNITPVLDELLIFMKEHNLMHSAQRLDEMKSRLDRDGYTSFWR